MYVYITLFLFVSISLLVFSVLLHFKDIDMAGYKRSEESAASSQEHETSSMDKKYGGLMPKKKPLISKDPERAFFDSADWALCKQGAGVNQKTMVDIETLRPKLQRTPHQQLPPRRPACTS
ncbi:uncharacterized protein [Primulina huaijiensis]|uniref:uncharacterized protein isoform X1 n=2 Tax=Primulina huaijiensis TaxID=1492673 RepID=UPI003CC72F77